MSLTAKAAHRGAVLSRWLGGSSTSATNGRWSLAVRARRDCRVMQRITSTSPRTKMPSRGRSGSQAGKVLARAPARRKPPGMRKRGPRVPQRSFRSPPRTTGVRDAVPENGAVARNRRNCAARSVPASPRCRLLMTTVRDASAVVARVRAVIAPRFLRFPIVRFTCSMWVRGQRDRMALP